MKTSATIRIMAALVLLAFTAAPLRAQSGNGSYTNLTVSDSTSLATLDISGANTTFGTWGGGQALTLNLPSGSGTGTQQINFIGSGTSTVWQWLQSSGGDSTVPVLQLDQNNRLILYTPGTSGSAGITLDPSSGGTSTIAGNVVLPNQSLITGSGVLTVGLGDARYASSSSMIVNTGTADGVTGPAVALTGGTATGPGSFAGVYSDANGPYSTAIGYTSQSSGYESMAMGSQASAQGDYSVASGNAACAGGYFSVASGGYSIASGPVSTAIGVLSIAAGDWSTAAGPGTTASGYGEFVVGQFNIPQDGDPNDWVLTDPLFVVGNGPPEYDDEGNTLTDPLGGVSDAFLV